MAIYHFSAKVISRANGSSAVASAAYRSAERLHDDRLDRDYDFTNKSGVVHSEVLLPDGAPERLGDRSTLWNEVEATELRKDAQLAREIEFAIPRELNQQQGIELARDFVQAEFIERGMIADLNVHWDIGADGLVKPHAHVMLTMREVGEGGFGAKVRDWNKIGQLEQWRERWASHVNERLAGLDIDARIDHRSFADQGIDLTPQNKIGPAASRMERDGLELERIADHAAIARRNGERIIENPSVALDAITRQQSTFTKRDLAMFVHRHSDGKDQFDHALSAVQSSLDLIALGKDGHGNDRFTSRDMIEVEARLGRMTELMAARYQHRVSYCDRERAVDNADARGLHLSGEQRDAFHHATDGKDLGVVIGYAGTGKSAMLGVAREAWEGAGFQVRGATLSGIAAENLEAGSAIASRTIASLEHQWSKGNELLTSRDVLVIDEAGMIGSRQMERVLSAANDAGAKVVLVGDPQQLQAIEAGAAFRSIAERHGGIEITEIRRQQVDWQRDATRHLATERTAEALQAYAEHDMVHVADTREGARAELVKGWERARRAFPHQSQIILTHINEEVRGLNELARGRLREAGALGNDVAINAERGPRQFAVGDRIMFLRNDRELGVKNGSLGEIERVSSQRIAVKLDDGRSIGFDTKSYAHVDHGYAATIHKAQGVTAERKLKTGPLDTGRGVKRYARAEQDIDQMRQKGLSPMPHQETALEKARTALNELKPKAGRDLATAFSRQPELIAEAASGRTANAARAMQLEAEIRTNPAMRADRFVENWQRLHRQRDQAFQSGNYSRAESATASMGAMAKGLERDPQVDSLLRNRKIELGLHASGSGGIGHQLHEYLGLGRGRGLGIGM